MVEIIETENDYTHMKYFSHSKMTVMSKFNAKLSQNDFFFKFIISKQWCIRFLKLSTLYIVILHFLNC